MTNTISIARVASTKTIQRSAPSAPGTPGGQIERSEPPQDRRRESQKGVTAPHLSRDDGPKSSRVPTRPRNGERGAFRDHLTFRPSSSRTSIPQPSPRPASVHMACVVSGGSSSSRRPAGKQGHRGDREEATSIHGTSQTDGTARPVVRLQAIELANWSASPSRNRPARDGRFWVADSATDHGQKSTRGSIGP